jgi:ribosomal protein S18 acetylase RimI-like enzyme
MLIRPLTGTDAARYQLLRLRGLQEHPEAFASAVEEEQQLALEAVATRLQQSSAERYILGAFVGEELSGLLPFRRWEGRKLRHRASLGGMYVPPAYRGRGIGKALLLDAIARAATVNGLEDLMLAVTVGNEPARALYLAVGFTAMAREPRYLKIGEQYFDIEWMSRSVNSTHTNAEKTVWGRCLASHATASPPACGSE